MRPLISYDDLIDSKPQGTSSAALSPPAKKKRKPNRNSHKKSGHGGNSEVHAPAQRSKPVVTSKPNNLKYGIQVESRQLSREEIWDDSALIEAWNAAAEEYEVLNGPDKKWKIDPVNKSSLWYNIPPEQEKDADDSKAMSMGMPSIPAPFTSHFESSEEMEEVQNEDEDSRPLDFDTFVPQHDPSLTFNQDVEKTAFERMVPTAPQNLSSVSVDQAFQNAMGAWYWAGYWTGVYHTTSRRKTKSNLDDCQEDDDGDDEKEDEGGIEESAQSPEADQADLIPT